MICYRCLHVYSKKTAKEKKDKRAKGYYHTCCPKCGCSVYMGSAN